ncbi:MAG: hypothetical protein Q8N90_04120 [bacterium]|nr:hypothetical protein [bacterium]
MENSIKNNRINEIIEELEKLIGIKEEINNDQLLSLIRDGKVKESAKTIARQLGLPIDIDIHYVPKNYKLQNSNEQFRIRGTQLARNNEGIVAQISIPSNLPLYGSPALNNYPITVKVSENCIDHPFAFLAIMAHELSHILLSSLYYKEKDNEYFVDITPVMLGLKTILQIGHKVTSDEGNTTYGYLSDQQFTFVINKVNLMLGKYIGEKKQLYKSTQKLNEMVSKWKTIVFRFAKFIDYIRIHHDQKFSPDDSKNITLFFQPGYFDNFEMITKNYSQKIAEIENFHKNLCHYTIQNLEYIKKYDKEAEDGLINLQNLLMNIKCGEKMIKKYINIWVRIRTYLI